MIHSSSDCKASRHGPCMIYFPLEYGLGKASWADPQLKALGYSSYPDKLQAGIRTMSMIATNEIQIGGTEPVPCALSKVLNEKGVVDHTDRVEPNSEGGRRMAERFVGLIDEFLDNDCERRLK